MFLIGTLTFWLKSVLTLRDIFWIILSIFSGELVSLSLFPAYMKVLSYNPLACIYDIPYKILTSGNLRFLFLQIGYIILFGVLLKFLWHKGVKQYESQGG